MTRKSLHHIFFLLVFICICYPHSFQLICFFCLPFRSHRNWIILHQIPSFSLVFWTPWLLCNLCTRIQSATDNREKKDFRVDLGIDLLNQSHYAFRTNKVFHFFLDFFLPYAQTISTVKHSSSANDLLSHVPLDIICIKPFHRSIHIHNTYSTCIIAFRRTLFSWLHSLKNTRSLNAAPFVRYFCEETEFSSG